MCASFSFDLFITALSKRLYVPYDIIQIIKLFFGFCEVGWNTVLYCCKKSLLLNPSWNTLYKSNDRNINIINEIIPQYIVYNASLPEFMKNKCDEYIQNLSNEWSMIFHIGYYVTIFHSDLLLSSTSNNNNTFKSYQFKLCSFPANIITNSSQSIVYNKKDGILYTNSMRSIYSLNLNISDGKWNELTNNLLISRYNTSLCMVDNDRFIAILGGNMLHESSNDAELYAINCNKSIIINEMNGKYTKYDISLYHDTFHKIMICDKDWYGNMEWYDINKDKWIIIKTSKQNKWHYQYKQVKQIIVSKENPNMVFIGCIRPNLWGYSRSRDQYEIYQIDLRTNTYQIDCIWTHSEHENWGLSARNVCMLQM